MLIISVSENSEVLIINGCPIFIIPDASDSIVTVLIKVGNKKVRCN